MSDRPRFKVTSLSGYNSRGEAKTSYQILDTAYCCELVYETPLRRLAEKGAAILNGGDLWWPHGYLHRLWQGSAGVPACPCSCCLDRRRESKRDQAAKKRRRLGIPMRGNGSYIRRAP